MKVRCHNYIQILLLLLIASVASPQSRPAHQQENNQQSDQAYQSQAVVRTTTRLVVLDIVARNAQGQPVTGLKAEDFVVTEDGKPQDIAEFTFHQPGTVTQTSRRGSGNIISNDPQYSGNSCLNVILLDAINTDFSSHAYAQDMLIKYLDSGPSIQPTAVYALEGNLKLLHDFTTDTKALRDILAHYKPQGPTHIADVYAAASPFVSRGRFQPSKQGRDVAFHAMTFLAQALAGYPGRKNMIWISEGFPLSLFPNTTMGDGVLFSEDYSPLVEKIADDLMAAQVALYPISAAGVSRHDQFSAHTAMASMARRTGGKTFFNRNDIDLGVRTSLDDGATYYTAEYYPKSKDWNGKLRHIHVTVARPDVKLSYRDGYYAINPNIRFGTDQLSRQFSDALVADAPASTAVRFQAAVLPPSKKNGNKVVINIAIDPHTLAFQEESDGLEHAELNCVVWAYPSRGKPIRVEGGTIHAAVKPEVYEQIMKSYFPCRRALDLKSGRYTLRLGVVDRTSSLIGAMSTPLTVP